MPTAAGKTVLFCFIVTGACARGHRTLVVVHRRELLNQAVAKFALLGITCGVIQAGIKPDYTAQVQVCTVQTAIGRLDKLPKFNLVVADEAHHARAASWRKLLAAQPGAKILGVTATPCRVDGKGLGVKADGIFDDLIVGVEADELIAGGYLAAPRIFVPKHTIDLRGVRTQHGDYNTSDLEKAVDEANLTGNVIEEYRARADHKPCVVFCVTIKHAAEVAQAFRGAGYRSCMVSGKTAKDRGWKPARSRC
jgi:DNA repair protein RadD